MANSLSAKEKFELTTYLKVMKESGEQLTIVHFLEYASEALNFSVTEGNVLGACKALDTTPAKVFAKPADLVPALQARIVELEARIELMEAEVDGFGSGEGVAVDKSLKKK
tara:strand:- start:746 stop:1078 length:333 start_codon:yes stop_codon:yes gene_type:complete